MSQPCHPLPYESTDRPGLRCLRPYLMLRPGRPFTVVLHDSLPGIRTRSRQVGWDSSLGQAQLLGDNRLAATSAGGSTAGRPGSVHAAVGLAEELAGIV